MLKFEVDVLCLCLLTKQCVYFFGKSDDIRLHHPYRHLSFIYLSHIHHLVDKMQYTFSIAFNGDISAMTMHVIIFFHQGQQGGYDKCHRGTYLMGNIHEEAQFGFTELFGMNMFLQAKAILLLTAT